MKKILFVLLLSLSAQSVYAGGIIPKSKITNIGFNQAGFFIWLEKKVNPNACSSNNAIVLKKDDLNYKEAYAMLLAAFYNDKEIFGYSDECVSHDAQTYNNIRGWKYLIVYE